MYAKVIIPKINGRKIFHNKGSSQRCVNYLVKEAKKVGTEATFFGAPGAGLQTAEEVVARLDGNVKGLGKDDPKFHSLVLSPSYDELLLIGTDGKALQNYTQQVMSLYAENFNLKNGTVLAESNLVWAATIHQERKNRGTDEGAQGEKKDGLQTHVHIMVSARDADQKITLNPLGKADRFNRVHFLAQAVVQMEMQFGRVVPLDVAAPELTRQQLVDQKVQEIKSIAAAGRKEPKPLTPEQVAAKDARLDVQIARMNNWRDPSDPLDPERVKEVAKERDYDQTFFSCLNRIERNDHNGNYTHDPYQYLATGRVSRLPEIDMDGGYGSEPWPTPTYPEYESTPREIQGGLAEALERSIQRLAQAMAPSSRTQDVRSEPEKEQDQEQEMDW